MKTQIEIHFMCLDNKRVYFVFKTCCLISVLFSTKYNYFMILSISAVVCSCHDQSASAPYSCFVYHHHCVYLSNW